MIIIKMWNKKRNGEFKMRKAVEKNQSSKPIGRMSKIRGIAQKAIKSNNLSEDEVRKTLGIKRYE